MGKVWAKSVTMTSSLLFTTTQQYGTYRSQMYSSFAKTIRIHLTKQTLSNPETSPQNRTLDTPTPAIPHSALHGCRGRSLRWNTRMHLAASLSKPRKLPDYNDLTIIETPIVFWGQFLSTTRPFQAFSFFKKTNAAEGKGILSFVTPSKFPLICKPHWQLLSALLGRESCRKLFALH